MDAYEVAAKDLETSPYGEAPADDRELKEMALRIVKEDIEAGKKANDAMSSRRSELYDLYRSKDDTKDEDRQGRSRIVSSDVMDTIEWMMPSFIKAFAGGRGSISVAPTGTEDVEKAEKNEKLLNWQFLTRCRGFLVLYELIKAGLVYGTSYAKITWQEDFVRKGFDIPEVLEPEMQELIADKAVETITAGSVEEVPPPGMMDMMGGMGGLMLPGMSAGNPDPMANAMSFGMPPGQMEAMRIYRDVKGEKRIITYSGPRVDVIPPEDMLIDPEAKSMEDALYVIHRVKRTVSFLRSKEKEGIYSGIERVVRSVTSDDALRSSEESSRYARAEDSTLSSGGSTSQSQVARQKVDVYEWWGLLDTKGDGVAEPYLVVTAGDVIIRMERNPYAHGNAPFIELRPILDIFRFAGIGISELVGEFQKVKTALMRQTLDNLSFQNNQMWEVDENAGVDVDSLMRPRPGGIVFTNILGRGFKAITPPSTQGYPLQMMEFIQNMLEQRSGVTRYTQGMDSKSLNKMLALDTPIPMADGSYKLNKDIVAGDMVIGSDGKPILVLKAHPVQIPERAFEVTFKSGDVIRAGGEHRWSVKSCDHYYRGMSQEWMKASTEEIFDLLRMGKKVFVPRVGPVEFTEKDLPVPPYLLGVWLCDGNAHTNRFTTMEPEIVESFKEWSEQFYGLKDSRYEEETRHNAKHIPEIYLRGSFEQRLALLQGLMDTDGCIDKKGNSIFCNSEPALVETFALLVESLGGKPNVAWRSGIGHKYDNARPHAHVTFNLAYCPVRLPRKVARWRVNPAYWEKQAVVSIREIPLEPMRCLSVAADDELYCCGRRLTLTSNTATGITAIMGASSQRIELIARIMAESIRRMYAMMLELNQQFIDQDMVVRIFNTPLEISPDDLAGNFDVSVDIGGATGKEDEQVQQLLSLMQYATMLLQLGVMRPENIYQIVNKVMEVWGWKDQDRYLSNPQETEKLRQIMQIMEELFASVQAGQVPPIQQITDGMVQAYQTLASVVGGGGNNPQEGMAGNAQSRPIEGSSEGRRKTTGLLDPYARQGGGNRALPGPGGRGGSEEGGGVLPM